MPYCAASDVRLVVETNLTDDEVGSLNAMSDAEIDARVGAQGTPGELVRKLSVLLTAHAVKTRQPVSLVVGEYREDSGDVLEVWEREIERIYRLYKGILVKSSEYRHIDEDIRRALGGVGYLRSGLGEIRTQPPVEISPVSFPFFSDYTHT